MRFMYKSPGKPDFEQKQKHHVYETQECRGTKHWTDKGINGSGWEGTISLRPEKLIKCVQAQACIALTGYVLLTFSPLFSIWFLDIFCQVSCLPVVFFLTWSRQAMAVSSLLFKSTVRTIAPNTPKTALRIQYACAMDEENEEIFLLVRLELWITSHRIRVLIFTKELFFFQQV